MSIGMHAYAKNIATILPASCLLYTSGGSGGGGGTKGGSGGAGGDGNAGGGLGGGTAPNNNTPTATANANMAVARNDTTRHRRGAYSDPQATHTPHPTHHTPHTHLRSNDLRLVRLARATRRPALPLVHKRVACLLCRRPTPPFSRTLRRRRAPGAGAPARRPRGRPR